MVSWVMAKVVTFSDKVTIHLEKPELGEDYRLSRINSCQQFQFDCKIRFTPLLTPFLQDKHRVKIKKYIEQLEKI